MSNGNYIEQNIHKENGQINITIPSVGGYGRFSSEKDETVDYAASPSLDSYKNYLKDNNLDNSDFFNLLVEFESLKIDSTQILKYSDYLQYLINENKISSNRELYSHIHKVLDYMVIQNLIHQDTKSFYIKSLGKAYYSRNMKYNNADNQKLCKKLDYSNFYNSTSKKVNDNQVINDLYKEGGELYINNRGKFCLRLSKHHKPIPPCTRKAAEDSLSMYFGFKVKITDEPINYKDIDIDDIIFKAKVIGVQDVK